MSTERNQHYLDNKGIETLWGKITSLVSAAVSTLVGTIGESIGALDVSDTAVTGKFVKSVSETDGKVSVARGNVYDLASGTTDVTDATFIVTSNVAPANNDSRGLIYRRPATAIWNYMKSKIGSTFGFSVGSYNVLSEKGITVTGPLEGTSGSAGYVLFAQIAATGTYTDAPLRMEIGGRRRRGYLVAWLSTGSGTAFTEQTSIGWFFEVGDVTNIPIYYRIADGVLYLYWKKLENYDSCSVIACEAPSYGWARLSITWKNEKYTGAESSLTVASHLSGSLSLKQDRITPGTGLAFDGATLNHSNAVAARTDYLGDLNRIPRLKIDAQGHVTGYDSVESNVKLRHYSCILSTTGTWYAKMYTVTLPRGWQHLAGFLRIMSAGPSSAAGHFCLHFYYHFRNNVSGEATVGSFANQAFYLVDGMGTETSNRPGANNLSVGYKNNNGSLDLVFYFKVVGQYECLDFSFYNSNTGSLGTTYGDSGLTQTRDSSYTYVDASDLPPRYALTRAGRALMDGSGNVISSTYATNTYVNGTFALRRQVVRLRTADDISTYFRVTSGMGGGEGFLRAPTAGDVVFQIWGDNWTTDRIIGFETIDETSFSVGDKITVIVMSPNTYPMFLASGSGNITFPSSQFSAFRSSEFAYEFVYAGNGKFYGNYGTKA